jgi:drug/metabolite transporter (DMT)-like permease
MTRHRPHGTPKSTRDAAWEPANRARVHGQMIFARLLTATSFPVGAAITHSLDPAMLVLVRFALASAVFAPIIYLRHGLKLPQPRLLAGYGAIGACLVVFFGACSKPCARRQP